MAGVEEWCWEDKQGRATCSAHTNILVCVQEGRCVYMHCSHNMFGFVGRWCTGLCCHRAQAVCFCAALRAQRVRAHISNVSKEHMYNKGCSGAVRDVLGA